MPRHFPILLEILETGKHFAGHLRLSLMSIISLFLPKNNATPGVTAMATYQKPLRDLGNLLKRLLEKVRKTHPLLQDREIL